MKLRNIFGLLAILAVFASLAFAQVAGTAIGENIAGGAISENANSGTSTAASGPSIIAGIVDADEDIIAAIVDDAPACGRDPQSNVCGGTCPNEGEECVVYGIGNGLEMCGCKKATFCSSTTIEATAAPEPDFISLIFKPIGDFFASIFNAITGQPAPANEILFGPKNAPDGSLCIADCDSGYYCNQNCECEKLSISDEEVPVVWPCSLNSSPPSGLSCYDDCSSLGDYYCDAATCSCVQEEKPQYTCSGKSGFLNQYCSANTCPEGQECVSSGGMCSCIPKLEACEGESSYCTSLDCADNTEICQSIQGKNNSCNCVKKVEFSCNRAFATSPTNLYGEYLDQDFGVSEGYFREYLDKAISGEVEFNPEYAYCTGECDYGKYCKVETCECLPAEPKLECPADLTIAVGKSGKIKVTGSPENGKVGLFCPGVAIDPSEGSPEFDVTITCTSVGSFKCEILNSDAAPCYISCVTAPEMQPPELLCSDGGKYNDGTCGIDDCAEKLGEGYYCDSTDCLCAYNASAAPEIQPVIPAVPPTLSTFSTPNADGKSGTIEITLEGDVPAGKLSVSLAGVSATHSIAQGQASDTFEYTCMFTGSSATYTARYTSNSGGLASTTSGQVACVGGQIEGTKSEN